MSEASPNGYRRLNQREAAALTERHWVRLTRCCNNRCLFCLDTDAQDGTVRPAGEVRDDIARGARLGRQRLVLSGGEPTIHPELIPLVEAGAKAGYERVQIVTNGRMLARPGFVEDAVAAGLGEVTVSIHGHRPELHDRLVGVPGAFAQTLRGLRAARARPELIVNIDVVVCGENVGVLDQIIALGRKLGVHEFDLLQVQPAGRAAKNPGMLYDPAPYRRTLDKVFALTRHPDLFIWTNRFPVAHLEGFEELIQDPHKLIDEIRGRREQVEALLRQGEPFHCRGELCRSCYLEGLCDELHVLAQGVSGVEHVLKKGSSPRPPLPRTFHSQEIIVEPSLENEDWLRQHIEALGERLVIRPAPRPTLSECLEHDIPPLRLAELLRGSRARVVDIPPCLAGGRPVSWSEADWQLDPAAGFEAQIEALVERFAASRFRAKSLRCRSCAADATCRGQQVQRLRAFGLRTLRPLAELPPTQDEEREERA